MRTLLQTENKLCIGHNRAGNGFGEFREGFSTESIKYCDGPPRRNGAPHSEEIFSVGSALNLSEAACFLSFEEIVENNRGIISEGEVISAMDIIFRGST